MDTIAYGSKESSRTRWLFPVSYGVELIFLLFSESTAGGFVWIYCAISLTAAIQFLFRKQRLIAVTIFFVALVGGYRDFLAGESLRISVYQRDQLLSHNRGVPASSSPSAPAMK